ncbi:hypothetical protein [Bacillus phage SBSphiJ5]|nr:hypothetical protein [Bacillus phage SBSphiJ5]
MSKKEIWEAKAKVGDLIRILHTWDEDTVSGTILRVHDVIDMTVARKQLEEERKELDEDIFNWAYPTGTRSDEVQAFPPWVRMDVDINKECFGCMYFLENEDYEVLTEEEAAEYLSRYNANTGEEKHGQVEGD